ncbi:carbohydrate binding family 9 domain-containing protein [Algoriphagus limi]|uniref:Carbohydrate binding family 9 domain-containing protein n=1 Tax=Algoriphagus limi TaxID=2975273 RepID=A0ABT2G5L8_9BACT|nr:carbohydrate binding family 9 domain-containing protein [Algoriphagus limi]MCS5490549.1 carbohydrate binding family 9 domain-containing protein [Algoriphagus limi]
MTRLHPLSFLLGFLLVFSAKAQKINDAYRLSIQKASSEIIIDGVLDEQAWLDAEVATDFFMITPMDTSFAQVKTDVRMTYDDQNLYLIVVNHHAVDGPYMVESLRRDFSFGKNDNFLLFMDPFDDQTNGFSFGANAAGAQWDGIMYNGGSVDLSWDNKWTSKVRNYEDKWIFEAAIPFKSIRYKKGITEWGVNFSRLDLKTTEKSGWAPVPRQFPSASLAYTGILVWDNPPPDPGANISVIPYLLGGVSKDFENNGETSYRREIGMDAKISLTSSLNLDLTVNPDFSQVEVDRQVTNLDRFELFFPERRQFFLENGDLFANFGYSTIRPFFSRRIGLNAPIQFGARLSGKINKDWRIGAMNMQTGEVSEEGLPSQNFTVMALQRQVGARSNITGIFINKQSLNYNPDPDSEAPVYSQFNRNVGLEYNLASSNNLWTGKAMLLQSFGPDNLANGFVHAANLKYASGNLTWNWQHELVSENYTAEVGYVPRRGYTKINPTIGYRWFPVSEKILSHGPDIGVTYFFNKEGVKTDNTTYVAYSIKWRSQSTFLLWTAYDFIKLQRPFDPTNFSGETLPAGTDHSWTALGAEYTSKPQSLFTYSFTTRLGGYYADGKRYNFTTDLGYRFQPYVSLALSTNFNRINLPEPWGNTDFWLVGPRLDVTMTNTLFFTAFVQYNEQIKNINLNTRFQWRFKPASDLFIVYTDNYLPAPFYTKNRSIVLKFTYWWNI